MRNDHVFYGHLGGRPIDYDALESNLREARRLRAIAIHDLLRDRYLWVAAALGRVASAFGRRGRRPAAAGAAPKLEHC